MLVDFEKHLLQHIFGGCLIGDAPPDELLQGGMKRLPDMFGRHRHTLHPFSFACIAPPACCKAKPQVSSAPSTHQRRCWKTRSLPTAFPPLPPPTRPTSNPPPLSFRPRCSRK